MCFNINTGKQPETSRKEYSVLKKYLPACVAALLLSGCAGNLPEAGFDGCVGCGESVAFATEIHPQLGHQQMLAEMAHWLEDATHGSSTPLLFAGDTPSVEYREHLSPEGIEGAMGAATVDALYLYGQDQMLLPSHANMQSPYWASVVLHEMVHHLQNGTYRCAEAGCAVANELLAYELQVRWLEEQGHPKLAGQVSGIACTYGVFDEDHPKCS